MKRILIVLLVLLMVAIPAAGQTVDKGKLRAAAYLPRLVVKIGLTTGELDEREPSGKKIDFAARAADLHKRLDGSTADVAVYLELARCYRQLKDETKQTEAARKAEALLRPQLDTPAATGRVLADYCIVLRHLRPNDFQTREKRARKATQLAPQEWRAWAELAHVRDWQFCSVLYGGDDKVPGNGLKVELADLLDRKYSSETLDEAEKCSQESEECLDRVRRLAPQDPQARKACFDYIHAAVGHKLMLARLRCQPSPKPEKQTEIIAQDATALADVCPENMFCQVYAAMLGWALAFSRVPETETDKPDEPPTLTAEDRQGLQKFLDRLEGGAKNENAEAATFCHLHLACMYANLKNWNESETHARRVLELDGNSQEAWEFLIVGLAKKGKDAEALALSEQALKRFRNPRIHYLHARCLATLGKLEQAEQVLRDGLKLAPEDLQCILGLAAVLIQRSDQAFTLVETDQLLRRATVLSQQGSDKELHRDVGVLLALFEGLAGSPDKGRDILRQLQQRWPRAPELKKGLEALGP
jgi:tetratricopeptide (TPR) repeat protein